MNARTPYWPLFRNELGIDQHPKITWVAGVGMCLAAWCVVSFVPSLILFITCEGNLATYFSAFGDLFGFAQTWWLAITGWMFAFALLPGMTSPAQNARSFEFMFTRAVDRRRLFRTRAIVIYAVMLGPLLLNVLVSPLRREIAFGPDAAGTTKTVRQAQYLETFPGSPFNDGNPHDPSTIFVIPHGVVILTGWMLWLGTLGLLLMQGYCVLIARYFQHNIWLAGVAIATPVFLAFFLAPWIPRHHPGLYEAGFLFFARHLVPLVIGLLALVPVVQIFSELRFSKLEIL